ncbi:MAG: Cysteine--tRNA ligase [Chroococcopsis gigantea SAG 12.99]|jgi:cysteinyl-tRNA synthetase|nr:cysteine--tRNA ligase [Chlorogloea purpurea SAG 13.99]MDV2999235.1 Cysteine--tRNA ligase [Chroococcopsis gigantea SAG 12.99]
MTLTLYNTLTRREEPFQSIEPGHVRMYCCGITVYDYCHLGHARTCVIWDLVRRYLEFSGYKVHYIQNFTDIDDKILKRAKNEGVAMAEIADRFIEAYFEDMEKLGVRKADAYPRATHTLDGIKRLVYELQQKGYAYEASGDVYYSVSAFPEYGKLSGRKLADLQAGASGRVETFDEESQKKQNPFDFALWKAAKPDEPNWESPWGKGRPGWHIECSAMVREKLGETIDIHVGGNDLIFPHHENEIAQSEAVTGKPLARYWLHNGMVKIGGEKMSKSLKNFVTIRELLGQYHPMPVRLLILQAHYRKPLDFSDSALTAAVNGWQTLEEGLSFGYKYGLTTSEIDEELVLKFKEAVAQDFNFPAGLAVLFETAKELRRESNILVHEGKTTVSMTDLAVLWRTLVTLADVLGLVVDANASSSTPKSISDEEVEKLIEERKLAKKAKNYQESDRIRDYLQSQGITLIDAPGGVTKWHRS